MNSRSNRRKFLQLAAMAGVGITFNSTFSKVFAGIAAGRTFVPNRAASWWTDVSDLLWPQKHVVDKIRRRADGFAKAGIDTAINFGFHCRVDFANYFGQLHGFYANVAEELHQRGIRWMDHYSCNHVCRPRNEADFKLVNKWERHSVLLFSDATAAAYAQYEGHLFNDLCEVDLRDGSRGYAKQYQFEAFCHNNPGFRDMHVKYLQRLMREVSMDGIQVDDMCSYAGNTTCGCKYCRERFGREYGHEIPSFPDKNFFGDTSRENMLEWGNYENPVYRDWLRMKSDSVRDHIRLIKETVGALPLMTCCSDTGPMVLNAVALDLEKMSPYLDLFMMENVGTNIQNTEWIGMDAEALSQKDIAAKRGNAPALACSYELSERGAYLGWALARFWGVANWSSTLNGRLEEDPPHAMEMEDVIGRWNNWEKKYSELPYWEGKDLAELRVVNNRLCRENGWRDAAGNEHWDRVKAWSKQLVKSNVGYRIVRAEELANAEALLREETPLVLDGVGCVSDEQLTAIKKYLDGGGVVWMALPFGTHDEKGFTRARPLSELLLHGKYKKLTVLESAVSAAPLAVMIGKGRFKPVLRQTKGDSRWAARIRTYAGVGTVIHFMNRGLAATSDEMTDLSGIPMMKEIVSVVKDNVLEYALDTGRLSLSSMTLLSPELEGEKRVVTLGKGGEERMIVDLTGVAIYGIVRG